MMALDFMTADHSKAEFDFETSLWEDEDTRTFHENLIDLRTMVPGVCQLRDVSGCRSKCFSISILFTGSNHYHSGVVPSVFP